MRKLTEEEAKKFLDEIKKHSKKEFTDREFQKSCEMGILKGFLKPLLMGEIVDLTINRVLNGTFFNEDTERTDDSSSQD